MRTIRNRGARNATATARWSETGESERRLAGARLVRRPRLRLRRRRLLLRTEELER